MSICSKFYETYSYAIKFSIFKQHTSIDFDQNPFLIDNALRERHNHIRSTRQQTTALSRARPFMLSSSFKKTKKQILPRNRRKFFLKRNTSKHF